MNLVKLLFFNYMSTYTYIVANTNQGVVQRETPQGYYLIDSKTDEETFVNKKDVIEIALYQSNKENGFDLLSTNRITTDNQTITILSHVDTSDKIFNLNKEKSNCLILKKIPITTKVLKDGKVIKTIEALKDGKVVKKILNDFENKACIKIGEPQGDFQRVRTHFNKYEVRNGSTNLSSFKFSVMELMVPVSFLEYN